MKVNYTENGNCYVLTNFAASNNPLFMEESEVDNFKRRLNLHLASLCEILGYSFHNDHYQLLVVLKDRESYIAHYRTKKEDMSLTDEDIPASTYILSQEMANIQSGYAKWFNNKHRRYGAVFGRRYTRELVEDEESLEAWLKAIHDGRKFWTFEEFWSYTSNFIRRFKGLKRVCCSSVELYDHKDSGKNDKILVNFLSLTSFLLRGTYVPLIQITDFRPG